MPVRRHSDLSPLNPITVVFATCGIFFASLAAFTFLAGCSKTPQIAQYKVPKEPADNSPANSAADDAAPNSADENGQPTDRMLAAIVPVDGNAWTFKLTGSAEAVGKHADEFAGLIQSITFPKDANGQPQWKLPDGWTQRAGGGQMRFATITIPEPKPLELTVATIPWPAGDDSERLLMNVNRWRGQMQLEQIAAGQLPNSVRSLKFADGEAAVVDLVGKLKTGGMMPPFAGRSAGGGGAGGALPPGHPDISLGNDLPAGHPPINSGASSPDSRKGTPSAEPAASAPSSNAKLDQLPLTFTAPKDWHSADIPQFAVAAFSAGQGEKRVDVTVTPMFGPGGDLLGNVNRWRTAQTGLPAITADELPSCTDPYKVDGKPAHLVRLFGPDDANPQPGIEAALVQAGDATWIFKMRGTATAVKAQQDSFQKFVDSIKFKP